MGNAILKKDGIYTIRTILQTEHWGMNTLGEGPFVTIVEDKNDGLFHVARFVKLEDDIVDFLYENFFRGTG